jgi:hypothetical protein
MSLFVKNEVILGVAEGPDRRTRHQAAPDRISELPLEEKYIWRVVAALKWAFCDLDTESANCRPSDLHTLSEKISRPSVEPLSFRAIQFWLFVNALLGEAATVQLV